MNKWIVFIGALILTNVTQAQQNAKDLDTNAKYELGKDFFNHSLYGPSAYINGQYINLPKSAITSQDTYYGLDAAAMIAIGSLRQELPSGENEVASFISHHYPDPATIPVVTTLASHYYNQRGYEQAIDMYSKIDIDELSGYDRSEASFRKGYCYFILKDFKAAKAEFARTKEVKDEFYYTNNYYYGICDYFLGDYTNAVSSFEKVNKSDVYKSFVPYYITQIYAAQNQSDKVIQYGEKALSDTNLRNRKEIRLLLGQAYFKSADYEKAIPHLMFYAESTPKLSIEEFYQLGFAHYKLKNYKQAIPNFMQLNLEDSKLGQMVNYYLADCYYKIGDLQSARTAFKKVSQMDYEPTMKEEATFNYGKLSAEAGFEREAINTLIKIPSTSTYHKQSHELVFQLVDNMSDYGAAITILEGMPSLDEKFKKVYQKVALYQGIQSYNNGNIDYATSSFNKSLKYKIDKPMAVQAQYWNAIIHNDKKEYVKSNDILKEYFAVANSMTNLPEESSIFNAYYLQGYNHFMSKDYTNASKSFKSAISALNAGKDKFKNSSWMTKIYTDALIRNGDCLFKLNNYIEAFNNYDQAASRKQGNFVYAMYQKGILEGLMKEPYEKIITMNDLKKDYPNAEYADDALIQLGDTYFELDNVDNAYNSFSELVKKYPTSPLRNNAYLKLGLIAYNKGDLNTAITQYKEVFKNNPSAKESESALIALQEIYISDLGKSDEYVAYVNTLPGYKVTDTKADSLSFMTGEQKYIEGDYDKAVTFLTTYIDKYPKGRNKIKAVFLRAESNTLLKKYTESLTDYESVVALGVSEYYQPAVRKAGLIAYNYAQNFEKALKYYDLYYQLLTDENDKYQAALGALRSAFRQGNKNQIKNYGNIVSTNSKATNDEKSAATYYLAKTYYSAGEMEQAKANFIKTADLSSNNQGAESRYFIADILFKDGKVDQAEDQCNAANEKNAAYPYWIAKSLILLSDIYIIKKDLFNARAALEAVIENFKDDKGLVDTAKEKLKNVESLEKESSRIKPKNNSLLEMQSTTGKG